LRALHRWIMTIGAVLLAYWAVTGVTMAIVDITDSNRGWANDGGGPGSVTPKTVGGINVQTAAPLTFDDMQAMTASALQAIRRAGITQSIAAIQLRKANADPRAVITLSGASGRHLLISTRDQRIIDANAPALPPGSDPAESLHSEVKNWHRGTVGNGANGTFQPGNILAFLAGFTLLCMLVTGVVVYIQLWVARRRLGRPAFFWSERSGSRLRKIHRWIAIIAGVFLLNQCITGMMLAAENISEQFHFGAKHAARPFDFADSELAPWLQEAYRQARAAMPDAPIIAVLLRKNDGEPFAAVYAGGERAGAMGIKLVQHYYIFGAAGPVSPGGAAIDFHSLLKRFHRGDIIGVFAGRYITLAAGLCLIYLVISGIWMYFSLRRSRQALGRGSWFW